MKTRICGLSLFIPLVRRFQVLEALAPEDQETVIKVIDAMIAKERRASALTPVDAPA